jgi:hypothetical protein
MIALRHDDVEDLHHHARAKIIAAGRLTGPSIVTTDGLQLQTGHRIVCLRTDPRLGVVDGTRPPSPPSARVCEPSRSSTTRPDRPPATRYLDAGHVAHGYAITGHKAQG